MSSQAKGAKIIIHLKLSGIPFNTSKLVKAYFDDFVQFVTKDEYGELRQYLKGKSQPSY